MKPRMHSLYFLVAVLLVLFSSLAVQGKNVFQPEAQDTININGSYYFVSNIDGTIDEAISTCNDIGMKLISIQSQEKQQMIAYYLDTNGHSAKQFWTSGVRVYSDLFIWSGTGQKYGYSNWNDKEPNELLTNVDICMLMLPESIERKWADWPCSHSLHFICEEINIF